MKKLIYSLSVTLLLLQSCSSGSDSSNNNTNANTNNTTGNVDYEFTITLDGIIYKVKGNTAKDDGYSGSGANYCIAKGPVGASVSFSIRDVTYYNFVSGKPFELLLSTQSAFALGNNNMMEIQLKLNGINYAYYAVPGGYSLGSDERNRLQLNITDLGTPRKGTLDTSNVIFGNPIKGSFSGKVYSRGYPNIDVPHDLSINFIAVRLY